MDKTTLDKIFALCLKTYECECGKNPNNVDWQETGWRWNYTHFVHHLDLFRKKPSYPSTESEGTQPCDYTLIKDHIRIVKPAIPLYLITKEELAAILNCIKMEYLESIPEKIQIIAAAHNLVIAYGASDDLLEFRGAIYDEMSCYNGDHAFIDSEGLVMDRDAIDNDDDDALLEHLTRKKIAKTITAIWDSEGYSWVYKTTIPHATFEILEDGDKYCRGIVFNLKELEAK